MPRPCLLVQEGISIFCAVKNRSGNLARVLRSWLAYDEVDEIIIADWGSEDALASVIKEFQNGKILIVRALDQPKWVLSKAFNLAARFTQRQKMLKLDADVVLGHDFFKTHPLEAGEFYTGNWRRARNDNDKYLNGILYCFRGDFFKVGGYNEGITSYGWDDCDLYSRLEALGLRKKDLNHNKLIHLPHGDDERLQFQPEVLDCRSEIQTNREKCEQAGGWGSFEKMADYQELSRGLDEIVVKELPKGVPGIFSSESEAVDSRASSLLEVKRIFNRLKTLHAKARVSQEPMSVKASARRRVSIITSVFNGDKLIRGFLREIVRQTYFPRCELILINANSPGGEEGEILEYLKRFPNMIYRKLDHDPGLYSVWNKAIQMSSGEYITNANLDDRRAPDHIEKHVQALDANPGIDVVSAPLRVTRGEDETWEKNTAYAVWFLGFPATYGAKDLFRKDDKGRIISQNLAHCMPVWRRKLHDQFGYFDETGFAQSCTDWEFWLRCATGGARFMMLEEPLGLYHWNEASYGRQDPSERATVDRVIQQYYDAAMKKGWAAPAKKK
ncbi:MAG: glycosyltransferase [Candidatus Omnitrophota bacterium]